MKNEKSSVKDTASTASCMSGEELLSNLMSALAAGARAVQGLPIEDDFEYQSSFPEFSTLVQENQDDLLDAIVLALSSADEHLSMDTEFQGLSDPLLWDACSDICEYLTEQAEVSGASRRVRDNLSGAAGKAKSSFGQLMKGIVKMEKPQEMYNIYEGSTRNLNSRVEPFVPPIAEKYHAVEPLNLRLKPKSGLSNRFGAWRPNKSLPPDIVAPSHHVPHPYQAEIKSFAYTDYHLSPPASKPPKIVAETGPLEATWIDTKKALFEMSEKLNNSKEIAVDLEAHSYRSFGGITCLIQITMGATESAPETQNYLIDPFPVWHSIGNTLGPIFANPSIVKVMHGAESDVQWLQRDFGIYIVNLFDTYNAAKALELPRLGYAHLLNKYVGIDPDKSHQLADWRQRPLPVAMKEYAIMDTHYLLGIYQRLKFDLAEHKYASIEAVFDKSREVSLIRYAPEPFKPNGYKSLMKGQSRRSKCELNKTQQQVMKELYDWRDNVAREYDESLIFVCENSKLLRLALACPTNLTSLQGLLQPMPPLILRHSKQILGLIQKCIKTPYFQPATLDTEGDADDNFDQQRTLMSPVLGTEALYREAGWISPHENSTRQKDMITDPFTTDDDDGSTGDDSKPRKLLSVHQHNREYMSSKPSAHGLHIGSSQKTERSGLVDGKGPARAIHSTGIEEESEVARSNAENIRIIQEKHAMYGLISETVDLEDGDADDEAGDDEEEEGEKINEEHFVIPRSMREIYRISNHNRRNKKSASPLTLKPSEKESQELMKADEILKARAESGKNYFDEIPGTPKRQRTRSTTSASSEDIGHDSGISTRDEDIAMMKEVGWIKGKEDVDAMMKRRDSTGEEDADVTALSSEDDAGKQTKKSFDYSTVGSIGAFCSTPSDNPFFSGAATAGGYLNQQFGRQDKKKQSTHKGKQSRRQQQTERPEKNQGRSQAYKKR